MPKTVEFSGHGSSSVQGKNIPLIVYRRFLDFIPYLFILTVHE